MAGPQSAPMNALYQQFLRMQYLSRHPTGVPWCVEDWKYARGWTRAQSNNGTGDFKIVTEADLELAASDVKRPGVFNGKQMCEILSSGVASGFFTLYPPVISALPSMRLGMEVNFAFPYTLAQLQARMNYCDLAAFSYCYGGALMARGRIRYLAGADTLNINDGVANTVILENVFGTEYHTTADFLCWHNIKFIFDLTSGLGNYVKVFFNEREIDLSIYPSLGAAPTNPERILRMWVEPRDLIAPVQFKMYLGNVICTMEEP